jgi:predicted secreted protein
MPEDNIEKELKKLEDEMMKGRCDLFEQRCDNIEQLIAISQQHAKELLRTCEEMTRQIRAMRNRLDHLRRAHASK